MSRAASEAITANYKALKEEFVSNLTGGSIGEINYVTAVAPVAVLVWSSLQSRYDFFYPRNLWTYAVEFFINVITILLATTIYASKPLTLNALLLAPLLIIYFFPSSASQKKTVTTRFSKIARRREKDDANYMENTLPKRPFLTTYRGSMLVITSLSILSIDFHIFPRRFAKVETWGTSLMDVGVGSFVFSTGIVAAKPLLKSLGEENSLNLRLLRAGRHSLPLLVLGFLRLWSVKGLNYAEHVSEYGVHWNFFFTLGLLPPFVTIFQTATRYIPSYTGLSVLLGTTYQIALDFTDLKSYMLTSPRVDFLSMNREGIFSFTGYLAIFLAGQGTGLFVLPRRLLPKTVSAWQNRKRLLLLLGGWSLIWTILYLACTHRTYGLNMTVSRRLANLPYIFWVLAFNTCQLSAFCFIETLFFPNIWSLPERLTRSEEEALYNIATSGVLEAFNRNGLVVFLLANILTGAVNLTFSTLDCSDVCAIAILVVYGVIITGFAIILDLKDVTIRL